MQNKKIERKIEKKVEIIKEVVFFNPDIKEIQTLAKVVNPSVEQMDSIYRLYKKYIDKNATPYCLSCHTSSNSIVTYFWKVVALDTNNLIEKK
jgi:hypothetical protein